MISEYWKRKFESKGMQYCELCEKYIKGEPTGKYHLKQHGIITTY